MPSGKAGLARRPREGAVFGIASRSEVSSPVCAVNAWLSCSPESGGGNPDVAALGAQLNLWEVFTAYPLGFCIGAADADTAEKKTMYSLVYSYLVRRVEQARQSAAIR